MKPTLLRATAWRNCLAALMLSVTLPVAAAPGAHGPDGEHLDAPTIASSGPMLPRLEAHSDLFELVAELQGGQLRIYVDRYASNEPVANASVEVEAGSLRALAAYQATEGYYLLADPALMERLAVPGEHALVFTVLAAADADLLNGILDTRAAVVGDGHGHDHGHSHALEWAAWGAGGLLAAGLVIVVLRRLKQRQPTGAQP